MRVYKEKQYLVFDYNDGRTVKYDFATKKAIGIKGQPVKDLKTLHISDHQKNQTNSVRENGLRPARQRRRGQQSGNQPPS